MSSATAAGFDPPTNSASGFGAGFLFLPQSGTLSGNDPSATAGAGAAAATNQTASAGTLIFVFVCAVCVLVIATLVRRNRIERTGTCSWKLRSYGRVERSPSHRVWWWTAPSTWPLPWKAWGEPRTHQVLDEISLELDSVSARNSNSNSKSASSENEVDPDEVVEFIGGAALDGEFEVGDFSGTEAGAVLCSPEAESSMKQQEELGEEGGGDSVPTS